MIGSLGALITQTVSTKSVAKFTFWPALAAILILPVIPFKSQHPGPITLIICTATLIILLRNHPFLSKGTAIRIASKIGNISYSLYLVHWPLFAFFNHIWIGDQNDERVLYTRIALIALSIFLAWLLNRYVEQPMRNKKINPTKLSVFCVTATTLTLIAIAFLIPITFKGDTNYAYLTRPNLGLSDACNFHADFKIQPECFNAENPEILIWGDSFAMHMVPGILENKSAEPAITQATKFSCGPLLGLAQANVVTDLTQSWAETCITFNESVSNYMKKSTSIRIVILASPFEYFLDSQNILLRKNGDNSYQEIKGGKTVALESLIKTVETIRAAGKKVVIIAPPPHDGIDASRCLERAEQKLLSLGRDNCNIKTNNYLKASRETTSFLAEASQIANVEIINFDSYLCTPDICTTQIDGHPLYQDATHLSYIGSTLLARGISLNNKIKQLAR